MSTRVPIAWIGVAILVGLVLFFTYHILNAAYTDTKREKRVRFVEEMDVQNEPLGVPPKYLREIPKEPMPPNQYSELNKPSEPITKPIPKVPAQTEEDLKEPEPLQATPPTTQYHPPEATDPMNSRIHMDAEFGSNLRHPEQMIERRPTTGMASVIPSGLGSAESSTGGHRSQMYSPEMAQNGGEFMTGIVAFDSSENGVGYSML